MCDAYSPESIWSSAVFAVDDTNLELKNYAFNFKSLGICSPEASGCNPVDAVSYSGSFQSVIRI